MAVATGAICAVLALASAPTGAPAQGTALSADLALTKSDNVDPVVSGAELTYTIEVRNRVPTRPPASRSPTACRAASTASR